MKSRKHYLLPVSIVLLGSSWQARAASGTWKNTGTDWNTDANWSAAPFPGTMPTDVATFSGSAVTQPALSAPVSISQIVFPDSASAGYTISGQAITLNSTGTGASAALRTNPTTNDLTATNTISANIALAGAAGSTQTFSRGSYANTLVLSGNVGSTAALAKLAIQGNNGAPAYVISGNNSFTAALVEIGYGDYHLNSNTAFGNPSNTVVHTNNTRFYNTSGGPVTVANNHAVSSNFGYNTSNSPTTSDLTFSGMVDLSGGNRTITVGSNGGKLILSNVNVGSGAGQQQQKSGNGILSLPNAITGTGGNIAIGGVTYNSSPWRINSGTLEIGTKAAIGGALDLRGGLQASTDLTGANAVGATIVHATNNTTISGSNDIELSGAYILSNGANSRTLNITNTGATTFSGTISLTDTAGDGSQTLTANVDSSAGPTTISGIIQNLAGGGASANPMGFAKAGAGILTLTNANTFSGTLAVTGGKLVTNNASGLGAASNAINVTGGTLQPDGNLSYVIDGSLAVSAGGTLRLGLSPAAGVNDRISGTGPVSLNGNLAIDLPVTNPADGATYTLFGSGKSVSYGTSFTVSDPAGGVWVGDVLSGGWALSTGTGVYTFKQSANQVVFASDTDGDGLPDAWEIANGLNPNSAAGNNGAGGDPDGDGFTNAEEFAAGSKPTNPGGSASVPGDVDGDNLPDAWEKVFSPGDLTKLNGIGGADRDGDGFTDLAEYTGNSSPTDASWTPAKASLKHRWSFTSGPGQLVDSVGGSNASVVRGANSSSNPVTFSGNAVMLAGGAKADSDAINLGSNLISEAFPVTIELWATQNSLQNGSRIFDFGVDGNENLFMSWSRTANANQDRVQWADATATSGFDDTNAPYAPGQKYHIVMTLTPAAFTGGELVTGTRVSWYRTAADSASAHHPLWTHRGSFDTMNNLADLNDAICALGLSKSGENVAGASYDEVRIWHGALGESEREVAQVVGADVIDLTTDADGDGMPDTWEVAYGLNPATNDAAGHADTDGESNLTEFSEHSAPNNTQSTSLDRDADGLEDLYFEDFFFVDLDEVGTGDPDGDFCSNEMEETGDSFGPTDPTNAYSYPDEDDDFLPDGYEDRYFGNNDGLTDAAERALQSDIDDHDNDGEDNYTEFVNGTDPTDSLSRKILPALFGLIDASARNGQFELQGPPPGVPSGAKRGSWDQAGAADVTYWTEWATQSSASGNSGVEGGAGLQHAFIQGGNAMYNLTEYIAAAGNAYWIGFDKLNDLDVEAYLVYQDGAGVIQPIESSLLTSTGSGAGQLNGFAIPAGSPAIGRRIGVGFKSLESWVALDNVRFGVIPSDADADGYDDAFEDHAWGDNDGLVESSDLTGGPEGDADNDGLSSLDEINGTLNIHYGNMPTKANDSDSDDDGLSDGYEIITSGTDPNNRDTDGDGLLDGVETNTGVFVSASDTGTNPLAADTDGDGFSDGEEVAYGTDPNTAGSIPATSELIGLTKRNGSFETLNGAASAAKASHWDTDPDGDVDEWTVWTEQSTAENDSGTETTGSALRDGAKHGYLQSGNAVRNITNHVITAGDILRLTYTRTTGGTLAAYLVSSAGGATVPLAGFAAQTTTATGNYELFVVVPAGHASIGQAVGVGFKSTSGYPGIDKVVLTIPGQDQDSDNDGIDDSWEEMYGLTVGVDDSAGDLDSDGTNNLTEFRLGLIPNDGTSRFAISRDAGSGQLTWPSNGGLTFRIERSTTLGTWTVLNAAYPAAASPARTTGFTDGSPPLGKAFYRVGLNP